MGDTNPAPGGRPRGGFNANIRWEIAERLYVEGDVTGGERKYPTFAEIAVVAGTTKGNVQQRARRYNWALKREEFAKANSVTPTETTAIVPGDNAGNTGASPPKKQRLSAEEILTKYIDRFAQALERGAIRHDTVGDLDKAVRLLAFVRGEADQRKTTHVIVSLDSLQAKHRAMQGKVRQIDDNVAGVIGRGTPGAIDAEIVEESHEHSSSAGEVLVDAPKPAKARRPRAHPVGETNTGAWAWAAAASAAATGTDD